jgi:hypothetical protein
MPTEISQKGQTASSSHLPQRNARKGEILTEDLWKQGPTEKSSLDSLLLSSDVSYHYMLKLPKMVLVEKEAKRNQGTI